MTTARARTIVALLTLSACGRPEDRTLDGPADDDAPPREHDTDSGTDDTVALPTAQLDPPSPNWADAVRCISPDLGDARVVDVRFWVNGVAIRSAGLQPPTGTPTRRALPADASLGVDTIRCALRVEHPVAGDTWIESAPAVVEPALPSVHIPPGEFLWRTHVRDEPGTAQTSITYPMAFGATKVSDQMFETVEGYAVPPPGPRPEEARPDHPVMGINWHQAARFTVDLSLLDGAPGCFTCDNGERDTVLCEPVDQYLTCTGWRLPTAAEWLYVADSQGLADTDLAVVGDVQPDDLTWWTHKDGDVDVVDGPHANTKLGAQCWWAGARTTPGAAKFAPVGSRIPNTYGVHGLCGNAKEWTVDSPLQTIGGVDPHNAIATNTQRVTVGATSSNSPLALRRWNLGQLGRGNHGGLSMRLTRTLPNQVP